MIKLRVIEGGKAELEEKILKDMFKGQISSDDIDRLRPCGDLRLVASNLAPRADRGTDVLMQYLDDQTS